jgi:histo-blood group ABO system transferase
MTNPKDLARDCRTQLRFGGLGSWERNKKSRAFVPRSQRNVYVCGGTWLGRKEEILTLCKELSSRINEDLEVGITAVFHDESHLNWYQAKNQLTLLNPELCFDPSYPQLKNLKPKIIAVDKNVETKWVR